MTEKYISWFCDLSEENARIKAFKIKEYGIPTRIERHESGFCVLIPEKDMEKIMNLNII